MKITHLLLAIIGYIFGIFGILCLTFSEGNLKMIFVGVLLSSLFNLIPAVSYMKRTFKNLL